MKKKLTALGLVLAVVASLFAGMTLTYFTDKDTVTNTFTVGNVDIKVYETDANGQETEAGRLYENVVPGVKYAKDPTIKNIGRNGAYARMLVTVPKALADKLSGVELSTVFNNLNSTDFTYMNDEKVVDNEAGTVTYVFNYTANNGLLTSGVSAQLFSAVRLPETLTQSDFAALNGRFSIGVVGQAIQAEGFNNDAAAALAELNRQFPVQSEASLSEAFEGVDFGFGAAPVEPINIDGGGVATITKWTDAWVNTDTTIRGVTFQNGAVFTAGADNVTLTLEDCTFYACDLNKITVTHKVNSGAGMCLNVEKASHTGVKFIIKNCTFIGENDPTLDRDGVQYNADGTPTGQRKSRGHAIALDAICGGGTGTLDSLLIEGCEITGVRGNAIQLYGTTGDITIKDTNINSWGMNNNAAKDDAAIRGDFAVDGTRTLTLSNIYFGLAENEDSSAGKILYHVNVGSYPSNTVGGGNRAAGTY